MSRKELLDLLVADERVVHTVREPARRRRAVPFPEDLAPEIVDAIARGGVTDLHAFQAQALTLLRDGQHVVLAGGTGAGKSLCYQLPLLEALRTPRAEAVGGAPRKQTALYLAPTKALAQDQARRLRELGAGWAKPMLYDGDTPAKQRAVIRKTANLLLTNPDMLSAGILPNHGEWATFLRGLAIVVIDESHVYRGVFGSHVAQVLRRLRRLLAHYGNEHVVFCLSSATIGNPREHARALLDLDVELVGDAGAPSAGRDLILWNPELDAESGERDSALGDGARIYEQLLEQGAATIVFARSRRSCELVHKIATDRLHARGLDDIADRIAPYRAGYTPEERRTTERALASGELRGVVATSALELGIDIGSLAASVVVTYPGTLTSLRQRWGRAGRTSRGLCVLVAGEDALDQYFMRHPRTLLERDIEHAVVSTRNPRIVVPHLGAAAAEVPLGGALDNELWAGVLEPGCASLVETGRATATPSGVAYVGRASAAASISLRSTGRADVGIIDADSGQLLGSVEIGRAATSVHPGAVYLHRGIAYLCEELDTARLLAFVRKRTMPYYTLPKVDTDIEILGDVLAERTLDGPDPVTVRYGRVVVTDQLEGYQRIDTQNHKPLGVIDMHLPPIEFETEAIWFAAPTNAVATLGTDRLLGSLHAAEHGMIAMLPLLATCDRWDIGGLSIDYHEAFDGPGIFIYDGHPGGVGIVETGFDRMPRWIATSHDAIAHCPCDSGCPSCVQSPKCGNLNEPLDKAGAADVLAAIGGAL